MPCSLGASRHEDDITPSFQVTLEFDQLALCPLAGCSQRLVPDQPASACLRTARLAVCGTGRRGARSRRRVYELSSAERRAEEIISLKRAMEHAPCPSPYPDTTRNRNDASPKQPPQRNEPPPMRDDAPRQKGCVKASFPLTDSAWLTSFMLTCNDAIRSERATGTSILAIPSYTRSSSFQGNRGGCDCRRPQN